MKRMKIFYKTLIIICFLSLLSSCGKMSNPKPIEGSGYEHVYPKI